MADDSKLGSKIKQQISRFAGQLATGLNKTGRRFVAEMLYGIQAAKDVKVSNVARSLNESILLIKTENRLCRNLAGADLTRHINRYLCWAGAGAVRKDTVLAVDLGDVRKEYARKMEYLARVRDGSTGELCAGYTLCEVLAAHPDEDRIVPLYGELYSSAADDFQSENVRLLAAMETVALATGGRGIFAVDRGGDRRKILTPLLDNDWRFVIRQDGDRHVYLRSGIKCSVERAAQWCRTDIEREVEVERELCRETKRLRLGAMEVRLPERMPRRLWLVVIRGFGKKPIMLLSNVAPREGEREYAVRIAEVYLTRWKCEEAYRFLKQSYRLEDVRVRQYVSLRNTYALLHAVMYFVSAVLGARVKLRLIFKKVCAKAKRFYEVAAFFQYAVADGIYRLLFGSRSGAKAAPPQDTAQSLLAFAQPPD
jgi:hypothetical protein